MKPGGVIVTGAGKGIGRETCRWFARQGWHVYAFSKTSADLLSLEAEFPGQVEGFAGDASDEADVRRFFNEFLAGKTTPSVLVNNAGRFVQSTLEDLSPAVFEEQWRTNTLSTFLLMKGILPVLRQAGTGQIINVISVAAKRPFTGSGAYCSSKSAQDGLAGVMREEFKKWNIRVTNVYPGAAFTNSWVGTGVEEKRLMTAADVAKVIGQAVDLENNMVLEDIVLRPVAGDL
ncbi:MAG: SDR family oxidoreductase [Bacteroidetes bacterium]|nr:SDR family oxidoreductase [Bacteroidota bacterium]